MSKVEILLDDILESKGIGKREFARKVLIRHPTIMSMCDNNIKTISLEHLAKICDELNVDISDLLVLKKEIRPNQ